MSAEKLSEVLTNWSTASSRLSGQLQIGNGSSVNLWFKKLACEQLSQNRFRLSEGDKIRLDFSVTGVKFSWQDLSESGLTTANRVGVLTVSFPDGTELTLSETLDSPVYTS
jgi:hypothetical protein